MTGGPCNGELRFWERVPAELHALTEQVGRVANALEAMNAARRGEEQYEPVPDDMASKIAGMADSIGRIAIGGRGLA